MDAMTGQPQSSAEKRIKQLGRKLGGQKRDAEYRIKQLLAEKKELEHKLEKTEVLAEYMRRVAIRLMPLVPKQTFAEILEAAKHDSQRTNTGEIHDISQAKQLRPHEKQPSFTQGASTAGRPRSFSGHAQA